jgi:hypothetical protein
VTTMKIVATYQGATGDTLELSSGITNAGTHRVALHAFLPLEKSKPGRNSECSMLYLSRSQALDLADAMKRAALELP